jgi:hypothetical protein
MSLSVVMRAEGGEEEGVRTGGWNCGEGGEEEEGAGGGQRSGTGACMDGMGAGRWRGRMGWFIAYVASRGRSTG